jgi:hypothetical protein
LYLPRPPSATIPPLTMIHLTRGLTVALLPTGAVAAFGRSPHSLPHFKTSIRALSVLRMWGDDHQNYLPISVTFKERQEDVHVALYYFF